MVRGGIHDGEGRYRFLTIRPVLSLAEHRNAWRRTTSISRISARLRHRLVTQMYFPATPCSLRPISTPCPTRRRADRLIAVFDLGVTEADYALGYRFDVCCAGAATPWRPEADASATASRRSARSGTAG